MNWNCVCKPWSNRFIYKMVRFHQPISSCSLSCCKLLFMLSPLILIKNVFLFLYIMAALHFTHEVSLFLVGMIINLYFSVKMLSMTQLVDFQLEQSLCDCVLMLAIFFLVTAFDLNLIDLLDLGTDILDLAKFLKQFWVSYAFFSPIQLKFPLSILNSIPAFTNVLLIQMYNIYMSILFWSLFSVYFLICNCLSR